LDKWFGFLNLLVQSRAKVLTQPFWGLSPVAVLPGEQGKGYGSLLIRQKLTEIDAQGLPCFLATQSGENAKRYEPLRSRAPQYLKRCLIRNGGSFDRKFIIPSGLIPNS
jgi:GNAT superfamily N-acetyltransferase